MENQERVIELVDISEETLPVQAVKTKDEFILEEGEVAENVELHSDEPKSETLDEEEDVPSDFFDDFSNQDFMAGLDVVDAWDEEEPTGNQDKGKNEAESNRKRGRKRAEKTKRRRSRSLYRPRHRSREYNDRKRNSRERNRSPKDKDRKRKSKDNPSESKDKLKDIEKELKQGTESDEVVVDQRRDPEKTKRDIQKDKDKCAKNKEAKIISEKLKVVETGLVPPGTEMEVDLKELKSVAMKESEKKDVRPERHRKSRSPSIEPVRYRIPYRQRRYSPIPRRISRSRDRSFERKFSYKRSRSPYRGRSRSRSRSRSSLQRRPSPDRRIYGDERRRPHRYRDSSPTVLRRRSSERFNGSPKSNYSEREMWLRQRDRPRKLSPSPDSDLELKNRKRSQDFLEELADKLKSDKKKMSFLKEIQQRLNESPVPNYPMRGPVPGPVPAPHVGPSPMSMPPQMQIPNPVTGQGFMPVAPQYFPSQSQIDPAPQYDQQFFIGQPDMFHNPNYQQPFMGQAPGARVVDNMCGDMFNGPPALGPVITPHPANSPLNQNNFNINVNVLTSQKAAEIQKQKDKEAITKLFEDKKISLSDYLSMTAKHSDPSKPVNVQKKIKVISLCQDAIKALGGDSKLNGRFFIRKTYKEAEKQQDSKFRSPLRKVPVVRFAFTTPSKGGDEKSSLQSTLNKLLASLGLVEQPVPVAPKPAPSPATSEGSSVRSVSIQQQPTVSMKTPRKYDPILGAKFQMKMCQTDSVKCHICEIRKARKFVDRSVQCDISYTDSGTQITDEDLMRLGIKPPVKDALKNQSLAHLTPAQLLARTNQEESQKKDIFPAAKVMTPPPPDISPEKQSVRASLSNNDSFPNRSDYSDRYVPPDPFNMLNNSNRLSGPKLPSIFDKIVANPYSRSKPFESKPSRTNAFDDRFISNSEYKARMQNEDDFEGPHGNFTNSNQRQFKPPQRGNFGRKFF